MMTLVEFYILRERTRPTPDQGTAILLQVAAHDPATLAGFVGALLSGQMHVRSNLANLMVADRDVEESLNAFIRSEGGQPYFQYPRQYEIRRFQLASGDPPEQTAVAMVFARDDDGEGKKDAPESQKWLAKGLRWEAMDRWSDAVQCYLNGLQESASNPDLMLHLGVADMHLPGQLPHAIEKLKMAYEMAPQNSKCARHLAVCYWQAADDPKVNLAVANRDELRRKAHALLQCAAALAPDDAETARDLARLRDALAVTEPDLFFE